MGAKRLYTLLDTTNVKAIMRRLLKGDSLTAIALDYECAVSNISFIADGRSWTELHDEVPGFKDFVRSRRRKKDKNHHMTKRARARRNRKKQRPKAVRKAAKKQRPKAKVIPIKKPAAAPAPAAAAQVVKPGMKFRDQDPRAKGRTIEVQKIEGGKAICRTSNNVTVKISLERLTKKPSAKKGYAPVAA